ncbi:transposase-like protein [Corynebacterium diphtheriae PW8]|nr:transposase-like protein [Corynebacterium diphtheriae PW8]
MTRGNGSCRFCSSRRQPARSSTPRIRLSCLTMSCVKLSATASNFTNDESALKTMWLMICNIEDKRLAKRAKESWRVAASAGRLVEGGKVSGWKQAKIHAGNHP